MKQKKCITFMLLSVMVLHAIVPIVSADDYTLVTKTTEPITGMSDQTTSSVNLDGQTTTTSSSSALTGTMSTTASNSSEWTENNAEDGVDASDINYSSNSTTPSLTVDGYDKESTSVDGEAVTPSMVFGRDDRVVIKNPTIVPYRQIVFIESRYKKGGVRIGSGVMIAPDKVLTAAHCLRLVDTNEWAESVTVYPARTGYSYPFGGTTGWSYHVLTSFKNDLKPGYTSNKVENDIAVVTLSRTLPSVGFLNTTDKITTNQKVQVVGYPGEKEGYMYAASGPVLDVFSSTLRYRIDTTGGNSGGPVLDENNQIVAINIAEPNAKIFDADYLQKYGKNTARRINSEALTLINYAKNNRNSSNGVSKIIPTFRLYNSDLKYHLYTVDSNEKDTLIARGWNYEGVAWRTDTQGKSVYRLYHSGLHKHVYTTDTNEKNTLARSGWRYEGVTWYSSGTNPVYRLYHTGLKVHLYTMDSNEMYTLSQRGWRYEGVAWNVE